MTSPHSQSQERRGLGSQGLRSLVLVGYGDPQKELPQATEQISGARNVTLAISVTEEKCKAVLCPSPPPIVSYFECQSIFLRLSKCQVPWGHLLGAVLQKPHRKLLCRRGGWGEGGGGEGAEGMEKQERGRQDRLTQPGCSAGNPSHRTPHSFLRDQASPSLLLCPEPGCWTFSCG